MKAKLLKFYLLAAVVLFPMFIDASPLSGINDWVEQQLNAGNGAISSYFFLLIGGIIASLLPCTYPLYPITVNIIKARSQTGRKMLHPIVYYSGIVAMYFLFGVIASVSGGAFNTVLHFPVTNLIIAIIIFILGLSSMDLLYLPIFSGSSGTGPVKSNVLGTFFMGMSAGLLSSACVGPVVVSILIGIASNSKGFSFIPAFQAAFKMMLFGIGVGLPFLLIAVFGLRLPKSGRWMKYIQLALGGLIMYFSYVYLEKSLLGFGLKENEISLVGLGIIIILVAAFQFQDENQTSYRKTKKALFILSGIIGCIILLKAFFPSLGISETNLNNPGTLVATANPKTEQKGQLTWYLDKEAAYKEAMEKNKPLFIDFHADWCTNCKEFQKITQTNKQFNEVLQNAVLLKVYEGTSLFNSYAADPRFPELKVGLPFFIITDKDQHLLFKTNDYQKSDEMTMFLSN